MASTQSPGMMVFSGSRARGSAFTDGARVRSLSIDAAMIVRLPPELSLRVSYPQFRVKSRLGWNSRDSGQTGRQIQENETSPTHHVESSDSARTQHMVVCFCGLKGEKNIRSAPQSASGPFTKAFHTTLWGYPRFRLHRSGVANSLKPCRTKEAFPDSPPAAFSQCFPRPHSRNQRAMIRQGPGRLSRLWRGFRGLCSEP